MRRFGRSMSLLRALAWSLLLVLAMGAWAAETTEPDGAAGTTGTPVPASRKAPNLAIITIKGEINAVTAQSFERRLKRALDGGADGIVIEIDTPGGEVGAVLEITTQIKQSPNQNIIAWINPEAISGGAIIALACKEIVVAPGALMGDAAPIMLDPLMRIQEMSPTERQKFLAPLLAELVDSARLNGYDEKLVQGFVSLGVELWEVENVRTGERYFIDAGEYRALFGEEPVRGTPYVASGAVSDAGEPVAEDSEEAGDSEVGDETGEPAEVEAPDSLADGEGAGAPEGAASGEGAQPGPSDDTAFRPAVPDLSEQTIEAVELDLPPTDRPNFALENPAEYRVGEYITDGNTLLTLRETGLKELGFADTTIANDEELKQYMGAKNVRRLDMSWSEVFVSFMTQGLSGLVVRAILIIVFLLGLFIELSMPGVSVPGLVALLALFGLIGPPLMLGAASWWAGVVIIGGILLVMLELFVIPGVGVPGILGILMVLVGLIGTFADAGQLFPGIGDGQGAELAWAISIVFMATFIAGVGMYLFSKYTHRFPVAGRLVLSDRQVALGRGESVGMLEAMGEGAPERQDVRVGDIGEATTDLRPAGSARFGDALVDVVSEVGFIERGAPVRAASVSRYHVGVEPAPEGGNSGTEGDPSA